MQILNVLLLTATAAQAHCKGSDRCLVQRLTRY
jgi:hypothetical protein